MTDELLSDKTDAYDMRGPPPPTPTPARADRQLTDDEIVERTTYHAPTELAIPLHDIVGGVIRKAMGDLNSIMPPGRDAALCMTKLEEARSWANSAIARNHDRL